MKFDTRTTISFALYCCWNSSVGFAFLAPSAMPTASSRLFETKSSSEDMDYQQKMKEMKIVEPGRNPDRPELPELKGDFDWDEKFKGDDDWIVENVPGKIVVNEIDLAKQVTALNQLEEKWKKQRQEIEYEESKKVGWVPEAELLNGRAAMFFLVTGLLTEYWTGFSFPAQVEEMLRVGGFIGLE